MLIGDEWFGHRDPLTGASYGDRDEWIDWDFHLARAMADIEALTDRNGIPQWVKDDPETEIGALRKIDEFQENIDMITGAKNYKKRNGEYFVPDFKSHREDKSVWSYADWRSAREKEIENPS